MTPTAPFPVGALRRLGFADIRVGGRLTALAYNCDCDAPHGDECGCPDATWFHLHEREQTP